MFKKRGEEAPVLKTFLIASVVALASNNVAHATNYAERESLARIVHELEAINALIEEAQSHSNPDARIRFQYITLKKDLSKMRLGIQEHLESPTIEPREYAPLAGDYRR